MDPQAAQRFIQTQPQKADAQAREWSVFASEHPGVSHFVLKQEFDAWARTHGVSDTSVWFGKEVQDAYFYLRKQHEEEQLETQGHVDHNSIPPALAALRFLSMAFSRERPKIMEEDPDFKRILKEKGQAWFDDHPDRDVTSKEWIDYRYGSMENPQAETLYKQTEEGFRTEHKKRAEAYDEERKKVYVNQTEDPTIIWHQEEVILHTQARHELLKQENPSITIEEVQKQVETYHWERFVEKHPEKANVYAQKHEGIKLAVSRIQERKKQTAAPKIETKPVVEPTSPRPPIIAQTSISPKPSQVNQQLPQSFETTPSLSFQTAQPPPFPIQRVSSSISPPNTSPVGGAGRLGNFPNPGRNPLTGIGSTLARARLLLSPLTLTLIIVPVVTFIITLITVITGPATITETSPENSPATGEITSGGIPAPPANPDSQLLALDILKTFGIAMDDKFEYNYLQWAWEKLWDVSNTNFLSLVRGLNNNPIAVLRNDSLINAQIDCKVITIRGVSRATGQPYPKSLFKVVFIHELSHIIEQENCNPDSRKNELSKIIAQEGYLTRYSENAHICVGEVSNLNEDYAETIAYFLNPDLNEQSLGIGADCEPKDTRKPYERNKPLHQRFAQDMLSVTAPDQKTTILAQFSCPVEGNTWQLHTPSFQKNDRKGHCGSDYAKSFSAAGDPIGECPDGGNTRRGKSLDVITGGPTGKEVSLPTINGGKVNWKFINKFELSAHDCLPKEIIDPNQPGQGCGRGYVFKTGQGNNNWVLHLVHMGSTQLTEGETYESGTPVGHTAAIHTHISIGKDIADPQGMLQTDLGWLAVDEDLGVCSSL